MGGRERLKEADTEQRPVAGPRRPVTEPVGGVSHVGAARIVEVQRRAGNRAAYRLATGEIAQPKLDVGPAGDHYEREADMVADSVMRNLGAAVTPDGDDGKVRRSVEAASVGLEGGPLEADVEASIQRQRGQGEALPPALRTSMEGSFGADFSSVRVHADSSADALNRSMQARAFTVGSDIFFSRGQYQPGTASGQSLLAHELTHTLQQGAIQYDDKP